MSIFLSIAEPRRHGGNQYFKALKEEMLLSQTGKLFVTLSSCLRASVVQQSKGKRSAAVPYANEYPHAKEAKIVQAKSAKNYSTRPLLEL